MSKEIKIPELVEIANQAMGGNRQAAESAEIILKARQKALEIDRSQSLQK